MVGYIKLYRDLRDNPIWQDKPFSKGQAWIDILLRCNHVCNKVIGFGKCEWVLRGQFISSNYKLAESWGWSESAVRIFIKLLESENMLSKKSFSKYTLYEVTNYCVYQSIEQEALQNIPNAKKTHKKRTSHAQKTPNNNDNNDKNNKKINIGFENLINGFTNNEEVKQALNDFIEFRKQIKKPMSDKSLTLSFKTLKELTDTEIIETINKSIMNNWQGLFPVKKDNKTNRKVADF